MDLNTGLSENGDRRAPWTVFLIKKSLKGLFLITYPVSWGSYWLRRLFKRGRLVALCFHHIDEKRQAEFAKLCDFLKKRYTIIDPSQLSQYLNKRLDKDHILFTFDDGHKSCLNVERKILRPRGIRSVYFICSQFIGLDKTKALEFIQNNLLSNYKDEGQLPMNESDLAELVENGSVLGHHTSSHKALSSIKDIYEKQEEIIYGKEKIKSLMGREIHYFAFPFGDLSSIDAHSLQMINENYLYCFSGIRGSLSRGPENSKVFFRQPIHMENGPLMNKFIVNGGLSIFHMWSRFKMNRLLAEPLILDEPVEQSH